tara:strand:+ start:421 stop:678 length:258 start_codon:yes stop_codon:yes gene_type:complete
MPIYVYECGDCKTDFKVSHGMTETHDECNVCGSTNLRRVPSMFVNLSKRSDKKQKVGTLTKDFITDAKEDLKEQMKSMEKERCKR